jgi:hypothetical protein
MMDNNIADAGGGEIIVLLRHGSILRKLPLGLLSLPNSWTTLRVALRGQFPEYPGASYSITGTPRLFVGLCSGDSSPGDFGSTTHFVGAVSADATVLYPGSGNPRVLIEDWRACTRIGTTLDSSASALATTYVQNNGITRLLFVEITKGSPNYTVHLKLFPNLNSITSATEADFDTQSVAATPAFTGHGAGTARTIAADESADGVLDHVCVAWNQGWPRCFVYDIRVYRVA